MSDDTTGVPGDVAGMAEQIGKDDKVPQATELVKLAESQYRFAIADDGRCFAVSLNGPNLARPLRGTDGLRQELSKAFYQAHQRAPSSSALADALTVIEGIAADANREPLALRVARHGDGIVLDLGAADGACVIIDRTGWRIESRSPVVFRRTELGMSLPTPERGGSLGVLADLLNVQPESWPLLVGWLVAALVPEIPHPLLLLTGEQGTGKSTTAERITGVIDPSAAPLQAPPTDVPNWVMTAQGSWCVALDNLSGVSPWLSDALCRAVTGDGLVKRQLYTDSSLTVVSLRRCIVLTAIDAGALRGDLAERLLTVDLERIDPTDRRPDAQLRATFVREHPRILGALLDLTAQVLDAIDSVHLSELPRMADFALVLAAVDKVTGHDSLALFAGIGDRLAADVVAADPVAAAVSDLVDDFGEWAGTASDLLAKLTDRTFGDRRPSKGWPSQPHVLSGQLKRASTVLRQLGIAVDWADRTSKSRTILLSRTESGPNQASSASQASFTPPDQGLSGDAADDAPGRSDARASSPDTEASSPDTSADQELFPSYDADDADDAESASLSIGPPCNWCDTPTDHVGLCADGTCTGAMF